MPAPTIAARATENIILPSTFGIAYSTIDMRVGVRGLWEVDLNEDDDRIRAVQRVRGLAWTPEGSLLVASADKLRCFDALGRMEWWWNPPRTFAFVVACTQAVAYVNGKILVATDDGEVSILDRQGSTLKRSKEDLTPRWLTTVGNRVVGTDGLNLLAWDMERTSPVVVRPLPEKAMGFAAGGRYVATRGMYRALIFDAETLESVAEIKTGGGLPVLALHPSRPELALADVNSAVIVDFMGREIERRPLERHVTALAYWNDLLLTSDG
ncbi:hypothetical protein EON81_20425 [bacterium]|nr:MAG: hypothetical protein EON81_20425 [bacterium]